MKKTRKKPNKKLRKKVAKKNPSIRANFRKARKEFDSLRETRLSSLLAAGVAHEFNNILGAVDGHADWALESGTLEDCKEALTTIRVACLRSAQITRALQQFAQPIEESVEEISLSEVVSSVGNEFQMDFRKNGIKVEFAIPSKIFVRGVRFKIEEIFRNLFKNSIEAFSVSNLEDRELSVVLDKGARNSKNVRIRISDSGPGIPEAFRAMVFRPFFTTKGVLKVVSGAESEKPVAQGAFAGGAGLGLYRSKTVASEMGGDLTLAPDSRLPAKQQRGAAWLLELPRCPPHRTAKS